MLSPEYYESCTDQILSLYEQLEDDIIADVIRRIMKTGLVTESAKHQIEILQNAGLLYEDILNLIAGQIDATSQQVRALFEHAGVETVSIDNEAYRENGETPVDIRQSPAMRQTLEAGYRKTLGNMNNLTMTTAVVTQTAYINACNQAYMQVSSGAFSYQEAIKQAVRKTAEQGAVIQYPSGHHDRIDVVVRRAVLTGVGQTCREISIMNAEQSGCDLMEITAYSGARPEHAKWQGQLVSLSGKNAGRTINGKRVLTLRQIGYGKGDGLGGWNCRHDWFPFFEGYSKPKYSDDDLKKLDEKNIEYNGKNYSQYEISQIQRRYEREIRAAKREQLTFQTAVDEADDQELKQVMQESLNFSKSLVKDKQAKMRDFIKQTSQKRDYFREQNYADKNIGNSLTSANKKVIIDGRGSGTGSSDNEHYYELIGDIDYHDKMAVSYSLREFEIKYQNSDIEHCRVITASGKVYEVHGNRWAVDTSILGDDLKGSINEHNHVTGESQYSFSWEDLKSCIQDGSKTAFAYDEKYRYFMQFSDKIISEDDLYDAYEASTEEVGDIRAADYFNGILTIPDEDEQHEIVKRTCEKVGITYGRNKK